MYLLRKVSLAFVLIDLILVGITLLRFPSAGGVHAAPVLIILILIGLALAFVRFLPDAFSAGGKMGLLAGIILGGEVILEYMFLPADNSIFGSVEYGLFLILLIAAGVLGYANHHSLKESAVAGLWTGILGSLIWYGIVLMVFHLFWGTAQQHLVFQAEGNFDDFAHSGMHDFAVFVAQDFFGAGFFHHLIGALVGLVLGWIGGLGRSLVHTRTAEINP